MYRTEPKNDSFKPLLIGAISILLIGLLIYSVSVFQKAYTVDPKQVFAEYFSNSPERVHGLVGGGQIGGYFDIWLYFESNDIVRLKATDWVRDSDNVVRLANWWCEQHPAQSDSVHDLNDIQAWKLYRHPNTVEIVNGEFFVNPKKNRYWLRLWGRK